MTVTQETTEEKVVSEWADTEEEYRFELATKATREDLRRWFTERANEDKFDHAAFALVWLAYEVLCNVWTGDPEYLAEMYGIEGGDATLSATAVDHILDAIEKLNWFDEKDGELHVPCKGQAEEPQRPFWVKGLEGKVTVEVISLFGDQRVLVREFPLPWRNFRGVYVKDCWGRYGADQDLDQEPYHPRYLHIRTTPTDGFVWHDWRREDCKDGPVIEHDVSLEYVQDAPIHRAEITWDDECQAFVIRLP
jgi:hypothetical protein